MIHNARLYITMLRVRTQTARRRLAGKTGESEKNVQFDRQVFQEVDGDTHALSTVALIVEAAELAGPGRAAVLGCGSCTEIPIRLLNENFSYVDLVDLDAQALRIVEAQCRQWADANDGYRFYCTDLTGLISQIVPRAQEIVAAATDPVGCLDDLGNLLQTTAPAFWRPPDEERYSLIVCATVLTQLQATVRKRIGTIFLNRFPHYRDAMSSDERWRRRLWNFARRLEDGFIDHLETLAVPGGIICLSATVRVGWLTKVDAQILTTDGSWIATRTSRLADYLRPWDEIIAEYEWKWPRNEQEGPYWGRLYDVQAIIYRIS